MDNKCTICGDGPGSYWMEVKGKFYHFRCLVVSYEDLLEGLKSARLLLRCVRENNLNPEGQFISPKYLKKSLADIERIIYEAGGEDRPA